MTPPIVVGRLLRRRVRPVVSGLYGVDGDRPHPAAWVLDETDSPSSISVNEEGQLVVNDDGTPRVLDPDENGLFTVDTIGLGCVLVHASVFDDIEKPWFRWTKDYEDHPWDLRHIGEVSGVSEDFYFCHKLAKAGYDVHLDTSVRCVHEKGCLLTDNGVFLTSQVSEE